jgi:predicted MFS family arabinose efflux permease
MKIDAHVHSPIDSKVINSAICLMIFAPIFFLILPIYVNTLAETFRADISQIGKLTASELAGAACASISSLFWTRFANLKKMALFCGSSLVVINLYCAFAIPNFDTLLIARMIAGIGEGCLLSIADFIIGRSQKPDRYFAMAIAGQMILSGILLCILPFGIKHWGAPTLFFTFGASALPIIICAPFLAKNLENKTIDIRRFSISRLKPFFGLFGMASFFASETIVWAFLERIGTNSGLSKVFLGITLGVTSIIAMIGGILACWLAGRANRLWIMIMSACGQIICLIVLNIECNESIYFIIAAVYQILWCLWLPFQMGAISVSDPSKRLILLSSPFQALGIAAGPAIISFFISDRSLLAVYLGGIFFALLSIFLFLPLTKQEKSAH